MALANLEFDLMREDGTVYTVPHADNPVDVRNPMEWADIVGLRFPECGDPALCNPQVIGFHFQNVWA